ncbi:hypothetical protein M0802_012376 [Mischocyttarus mexicanus]|nr:hypothetical protein M0802_012376 [Mischocyttarus mexicanus]
MVEVARQPIVVEKGRGIGDTEKKKEEKKKKKKKGRSSRGVSEDWVGGWSRGFCREASPTCWLELVDLLQGGSSSSISYRINSSSPETTSNLRNNNNGNLVLSALLAPTSVIGGSADRLSNCEISVTHGNVIGSINTTTNSTTTAESLNGVYSPITLRRTEESSRARSEEVSNASLSSASDSLSTFSTSNLNTSLLSSLLSTSSISSSPCRADNNEEELIPRTCMRLEDQQSREQNQAEYTLAQVSQESLGSEENEDLPVTLPYDIINRRQVRIPSESSVISPSADIVIDMKYETQTGPPTVPPHLTSTGVEPPHSSQGSSIIGGSEAEEVGVDNLLLSSWGATGSDYLESSDIKQTAVGLQDSWDTLLLGTTVEVTSVQSLAELKPLPPFTGYTGHLSINGISGHHYHAIASSGQSQSQSVTEAQPITDISKDWIDIADWIEAISPKQQLPAVSAQIYGPAAATVQIQQQTSTLQSLLTHGYAPLLQARLQAGNAGLQNASCGETPSSTSPFPPVSPPGRVSTSCSPDLLHSSFAAPSNPRKRSRPGPGSQNPSKKSLTSSAGALSYGSESSMIGGKEKPVHRCSICNRGFLNKSNIKVHLRTHTGEKPFRCDVCGKAFRQKAHLIKHQQIHKRIGRD